MFSHFQTFAFVFLGFAQDFHALNPSVQFKSEVGRIRFMRCCHSVIMNAVLAKLSQEKIPGCFHKFSSYK